MHAAVYALACGVTRLLLKYHRAPLDSRPVVALEPDSNSTSARGAHDSSVKTDAPTGRHASISDVPGHAESTLLSAT